MGGTIDATKGVMVVGIGKMEPAKKFRQRSTAETHCAPRFPFSSQSLIAIEAENGHTEVPTAISDDAHTRIAENWPFL